MFIKTIATTIFVCLLAAMCAVQAQAQDDPPAEFFINGVAAYEKLRKEYYVGALLLQKTRVGSMDFAGKKRMEMRVSINRWTPRRFSREWSQAIFLNNDQALTTQFADQIQAFVNLPKNALLAGDQIVVAMDPKLGTTVYLNGAKAFAVADSAFFDLLLNVWVGKRPPSSEFRDHILTFPAGQMGQDLLARFQAMAPTAARKQEVASWFTGKPAVVAKTEKTKRTAEAAAAVVKPAIRKVDKQPLAANKQSAKAKARKPIAKAKKSPTKATVTPRPKKTTKPSVALKKPTGIALASPPAKVKTPTINRKSASVAATATAPKAPATKPKTATNAAANKAVNKLSQQQLSYAYSANVRKLTHLNVVYPKKALQRMQRGKVTLKVKLNRKGDVIKVTEAISSRHRLLNKAAKLAVQKTAPYPKPPRQLRGDSFEVTVPFEFNL